MEPLTHEQLISSMIRKNYGEHKAKKARARRRAIVQKASRKANRRK